MGWDILNAQDEDGQTGLYKAVVAGDEKIVRFLLQRRSIVHQKNSKDLDADVLCRAILNQDLKMIKLLLEYGVSCMNVGKYGRTPIEMLNCLPAEYCHVKKEMLLLFLAKGIDMNRVGRDGQTLLSAAIKAKDFEFADFCRIHKANINVLIGKNQDQTMLYQAVKFCQLDEVKYILSCSDIDVDLGYIEQTHRHQTSCLGHALPYLSPYLRNGYAHFYKKVNCLEQNGKRLSPLMCAVRQNWVEGVESLLERKADKTLLQDIHEVGEVTPMQMALLMGNAKIIPLMMLSDSPSYRSIGVPYERSMETSAVGERRILRREWGCCSDGYVDRMTR